MSDNRTKEQRSYNMSRIRSKNTKPEILVRKFLYANNIRFRLHSKTLPGKPDIVIRKYQIVIFVNGCFWHSHENCKYAKIPNNNKVFWEDKIIANKSRDKQNIELLEKAGWKVYVIWECDLSKEKANIILHNLLSSLSIKNGDNLIPNSDITS